MEDRYKLWKLIILRPAGRSGSLFLQNLFDSHKDVLALPSIFPFYYFWALFHRYHKNASKNELIIYFLEETNLKYFFGDYSYEYYQYRNEKGEKVNFEISKNDFRLYLEVELQDIYYPTRKQFLMAIHIAYANTKQLDLNGISTLFLHEHYSWEYETPHEDFEKVITIVNTRNPRNSYASFIKDKQKKGSVFGPMYANIDINAWLDSITNAFVYEKKYPDSIIYSPTEYLNENPEKVIKMIANKIGISFDKSLLEPTFDGYPQLGVSTFNKNQKGFDSSGVNANRYDSFCSQRELKLVDYIFRRTNSKFYKVENKKIKKIQMIFLVLIPDFELFKLRNKSFKSRVLYMIGGNFFWSRMMFIRGINLSNVTENYIAIEYRKTYIMASIYKMVKKVIPI